jgi:hypothetical protein
LFGASAATPSRIAQALPALRFATQNSPELAIRIRTSLEHGARRGRLVAQQLLSRGAGLPSTTASRSRCWSRCEAPMLDVIFIAMTAGFFLLAWTYARGCWRM